MGAANIFLVICLVMVLTKESNGQFFTKTTKNIPKMGRSDKMLPNLVHRVARTLHFVIKMVDQYDGDGNGELGPEELMEIPLIQNAAKNYYEPNESPSQYVVSNAVEQGPESDESQRMVFNEHLLM